MAKKYSSNTYNKISQKPILQQEAQETSYFSSRWFGLITTVILIFIFSLIGSSDNIMEKWTGLISAILVIILLFALKASSSLKNYITPLFFLVIGYILWGGVSTFYAASGKFAIYEFSKLLVALFVFLLVLFLTEKNEKGFRKISYVFASIGCFFGVLSVDAASSGILSKIFKNLMGLFTHSYKDNGIFEQGIRITSIVGNPNIYSGFMALAVILSLYLAISSNDKRSSQISLSLLAFNALSYLLAFSMGSLFMFLIACLIMIVVTENGKRFSLFLLMAETAIVSFIFAFLSMNGLGKTGLISFIPVAALIFNAFFLYLFDTRLRSKINFNINKKLTLIIVLSIIVLFISYIILAFTISGNLKMGANERVMRAIYIPEGQYSLVVESSAPVNLNIESQNKYDLMRRTSTMLYAGTNDQTISFSVPDDSEIIKINFISSNDSIEISKAFFSGTENGKIHLDYPLLPNIVSNRVQNLSANENLVQRTVFFEDGMKLFSKSPIIGRGLGGFENGVYSVQDFYYETKYAHNHYIQVLGDLGIIGFILFISMLVFSAISIGNSKRKYRSLFAVPALAACVFQMFGQALVDAVWSTGIFLCFSAAVLALVTVFCAEPIKLKEPVFLDRMQTAEKILLGVFTGLFVILISANLYAQAHAKAGVKDFEEIKRLIFIDRFEYNDYKLSYIINAPQSNDEEVLSQADKYASELLNVESNSLAPYVMEYYFEIYHDFDAFEAAKIGIKNAKSSPYTWMRIFDTFEEYIDPVGAHMNDAADRLKDAEFYVNGVLEVYDSLLQRNTDSLDDIMLSPYNNAFIGKLLEIEATHLYSIDWVFTAIMTYAFDSECAVDLNLDSIPDNILVLSGYMQKDESGAYRVSANTVLELNLYHKLGGEYTFSVRTDTPQGIKIAYGGQDQTVLLDKHEVYTIVNLGDNSEMELSKFTVTFPNAAEFDSITFTTKLE